MFVITIVLQHVCSGKRVVKNLPFFYKYSGIFSAISPDIHSDKCPAAGADLYEIFPGLEINL